VCAIHELNGLADAYLPSLPRSILPNPRSMCRRRSRGERCWRAAPVRPRLGTR